LGRSRANYSTYFRRRSTPRNLRSAQSQQRQSLIAYKQAIQLAFSDVSDALIAYQKYYEVRKAEETTVQDLSDSVSASLKRYRGGIATYLEVLDNQRSLFNAQLTLAQDRGNEFQSLVQLYKALGGGCGNNKPKTVIGIRTRRKGEATLSNPSSFKER